jgi:hypothetical protein
MDWNTVTIGAVLVAAVCAFVSALLSFQGWRLQRANQVENAAYKSRLQLEERYFKLHLLWQELRVAAVTLESLPLSAPDYVPHIEELPINALSEALATKDLLNPEGATRLRVARDDLVQLVQLANDARTGEARRLTGFDKKFPDLLGKTLASLDHARQSILEQLPE